MSTFVGGLRVQRRATARVEHLLPRVRALAELVGLAHPMHQLRRNRLAGLVVPGEEPACPRPRPTPPASATGPRRSPTRSPRREPDPCCRPARTWCIRWPNSWKSVTTSSCSISAGWPPGREVAHQHPLGELLAVHARDQRELRRVLVLVRARVEVEVDAAELLAAPEHVVRLDVRVPGRRVRPRA